MEKLTAEEKELLESALKRYAYELRRSGQSERKFNDGAGERNAVNLEQRADAVERLHDKLLQRGL